jgi:hypothetical protein
MASHDPHHPDNLHTASTGLHPAIYLGLAGLCLWLIVSAWAFFGSRPVRGLFGRGRDRIFPDRLRHSVRDVARVAPQYA